MKEASCQDGEKAWRVNSTTASLCSTLVIADLGYRGAMPNGGARAVPYGKVPYLGPSLTITKTLSNRCHNTRETSHGFSSEISRFKSVTQQDMVFQIKPVVRHLMQVPKSGSHLVKVPNMQLLRVLVSNNSRLDFLPI